jgi:hypothetical protein
MEVQEAYLLMQKCHLAQPNELLVAMGDKIENSKSGWRAHTRPGDRINLSAEHDDATKWLVLRDEAGQQTILKRLPNSAAICSKDWFRTHWKATSCGAVAENAGGSLWCLPLVSWVVLAGWQRLVWTWLHPLSLICLGFLGFHSSQWGVGGA